MKTAEEYINERDVIIHRGGHQSMIDFVKQIQLEAFKAGERFAAELPSKLRSNDGLDSYWEDMTIEQYQQAILTDANNRTALP